MRGSVLDPSALRDFTTDPYVLVLDGFSSGTTPEGSISTLGRLHSGVALESNRRKGRISHCQKERIWAVGSPGDSNEESPTPQNQTDSDENSQ